MKSCMSFCLWPKEPIKVAKPKPKKTFEEQKKTEKTKVELKRRIPQEFHDFAERKIATALSHIHTLRLTLTRKLTSHLWRFVKSNSGLYVSFCCDLYSLARKSVRQSTSEHTRKTNLRLQERQDAPRRRRGAHRDRPLTQEELLAEAKITAEINIRSLGENVSERIWFPCWSFLSNRCCWIILGIEFTKTFPGHECNLVCMDSSAHYIFLCIENYERLEADKKKQVQKKRRFEGPTIRYHSVLMPIVSHSVLKEENVDVEGCVLPAWLQRSSVNLSGG